MQSGLTQCNAFHYRELKKKKGGGLLPFSHFLCNFHGGYMRLQTEFSRIAFSIATGWAQQGNVSTS